MILDDLFKQAALDHKTKGGVMVQVVVTSNQTGGFESANTNKGSVGEPVFLTYSPGGESGIPARVFPAYFSNPSITITSPFALSLKPTYEVQISGKSFVAAVDPTTEIIYGAAAPVFYTISICTYEVLHSQ